MATKAAIERKTWEEFSDCKMLWWINMILHTFGWTIILDIKNGEIIGAYPARSVFRGFNETVNVEGYMGVSKYMKDNVDDLLDEASYIK